MATAEPFTVVQCERAYGVSLGTIDPIVRIEHHDDDGHTVHYRRITVERCRTEEDAYAEGWIVGWGPDGDDWQEFDTWREAMAFADRITNHTNGSM